MALKTCILHNNITRWTCRPEFGDKYPRAIDEIWYRRAVEQHYLEPESFVYSVDFNAGEQISDGGPGPLVTATHAVFHTVEQHKAPAAVVGFQFQYTSLHALFINITSSVNLFLNNEIERNVSISFHWLSSQSGEQKTHSKTCDSSELDCYVLDNNGFVIVSESPQDAGRFFGEVKPLIMRKLVDEKVYRSVHITDYQAVCFVETGTSNPASSLLTVNISILNIFLGFGPQLQISASYFFIWMFRINNFAIIHSRLSSFDIWWDIWCRTFSGFGNVWRLSIQMFMVSRFLTTTVSKLVLYFI